MNFTLKFLNLPVFNATNNELNLDNKCIEQLTQLVLSTQIAAITTCSADLILQYQQLNLDSQTQATSPPPTPTPANTPLYNLDDTSQKESSILAKLSVSSPKNFFNSNQIRFNLAFFSELDSNTGEIFEHNSANRLEFKH